MSSVDDLPAPPRGIDDLPPPPAEDARNFFTGTGTAVVDSLPMLGAGIGGVLGTAGGPVGSMVGAGIGGGFGAAARNAIRSAPKVDYSVKNPTDPRFWSGSGGAAISTANEAAKQAAFQGTADFAAPYVAKAAVATGRAVKSGAEWVGTRALSNLGGVAPDTIKEYARFSDRINAAPSVEHLKDISDEFVGKLAADVEAKKLTAEQAQAAYQSHLADLKDAYRTAGYDARDAVTSAQQTLKDAHNARLEQLSGDIYDTVNQLKSDVRAGSAKALQVLHKSDAVIDTAPVVAHIDETIGNLQKANTDEALAVVDKLQAYKQRLVNANGSGLVPAADAKKLIQGLDQITEYSPMAGSFDKAKNAAFKGVRSSLDQAVKTAVPEYAQAMEPVAADAKLLENVRDFGDRQSGASILSRIHAPNQLDRRAALGALGDKYGVDFVSAAHPANLPEQALVEGAQSARDALRPDRVAAKVSETMASSREKGALDAAQTELEQSQAKLAPFKPLAPNAAGQTSAQQKLQQLASGKNIELTDMFQRLGKMTDTDFVQAMKDNAVRDAFKKGATNGSRNTLMGAVVGWMFGGTGGAAIGAGAGRTVDQWGPAITKKILDGAIRVSRGPVGSAAATIASLEIPEAAKKSMVIGLENYLTKEAGPAGQLMVAKKDQPNRAPATGMDAWAAKGLQNLGIQDQALSQRLMSDPKAKSLLIQASDYKPGSKQAQKIMSQIQKGWGR